MAIAIGNSANANTGAGAASLTINIPASTNDQELLVAQIAVGGAGATPVVTGPSGSWTMLRTTDNGTDVQLSTWYLLRTSTSEPANYTWTFDNTYEAAGGITCFRNAHNDPLRIANVESGQTTASGTTHATPTVTTTHTDTNFFCGFAVRANATWTPPSGMTERFDTRSTGALPIAVEGATSVQAAIITTSKTATSSASGVGCAHIFAILPSGISRTTTASTFAIVDDTLASNSTYFTFTEISAAYPVQFVDKGLGRRTYQGVNSVQYGGTTGGNSAPTTTIVDTNCDVIFDSARSLSTSATNRAGSTITLGTKITRSDGKAGGKDGVFLFQGANGSFGGTVNLYACTFEYGGTSGQGLSITPGTANTGEIYASIVHGTGPTTIGAAGAAFNVVYNLDVSSSNNSAGVLGAMVVNTFELVTMSESAPAASIPFLALQNNNSTMKDLKMFGSPVTSDLRWTQSGANAWKFVRPEYSSNGPKYSTGISDFPTLTDATQEFWVWDVKVTDINGAGIANVPITLTDVVGNVQVSTTTNSVGGIAYGSGLTTKCACVADHYISSGTTYAIRQRSPFLVEINTGASALPAYGSRRYYFNWPGSESVTTTGGSFEDMNDIISLQDASGNPTVWSECQLA